MKSKSFTVRGLFFFQVKFLIGLGLALLISGCPQEHKKVKNIILMIGDGMGTQQVAQAVLYRKLFKPKSSTINFESLLKLKNQGMVLTYSANGIVTDSAAAATAMACGFKTEGEMVGLDPHGKKCKSILHHAKDKGLATGLVSTTRLSHATPGPFAAQNIWRYNENEITEQMITEAQVDLMLDGGARHLIPQFKEDGKTPMMMSDIPECQGIEKSIDGKSKRLDQKDLLAIAKAKGYQFVCQQDQLKNVKLKPDDKLLGVFTQSTFPHIQERSKIASIPSLATMTETALTQLSRNDKGFFLMIEGGLIDYAGHDNDAGTQLQETLDFDQAVGVVLEYAKKNPDTLVLITADHETGGFGFSYRWLTQDEMKRPEYERIPEGSRPEYKFAPYDLFRKLEMQAKPFRSVIEPFLTKVYATPESSEPISAEIYQASITEFKKLINDEFEYHLTDQDAEYVLSRKSRRSQSGLKIDETPFCGHYWIDSHINKLAEVIGHENQTVWATGTHTASPVHIFAVGPHDYASRVQGMIDNTDIFKIMKSALE